MLTIQAKQMHNERLIGDTPTRSRPFANLSPEDKIEVYRRLKYEKTGH